MQNRPLCSHLTWTQESCTEQLHNVNVFFQNHTDFKKNSLNFIDDTMLHAKEILMGITNDRWECLQKLNQSREFVLWVKDTLEGTVQCFF